MTVRTLVRAGLQSGTIMGAADVATQLLTAIGDHDNNDDEDDEGRVVWRWDYERTIRWSAVGVTLHGPYFAAGFARLDAFWGASTTLTVVVQKTVAAQLVLFPPYLILLFAYLGWLEGVENIGQKVTHHAPAAFWTGCIYWPMANILNFGLVPTTYRIPYTSVAAGLWNCYLSHANTANQ
jgi:protein Mpv17